MGGKPKLLYSVAPSAIATNLDIINHLLLLNCVPVSCQTFPQSIDSVLNSIQV